MPGPTWVARSPRNSSAARPAPTERTTSGPRPSALPDLLVHDGLLQRSCRRRGSHGLHRRIWSHKSLRDVEVHRSGRLVRHRRTQCCEDTSLGKFHVARLSARAEIRIHWSHSDRLRSRHVLLDPLPHGVRGLPLVCIELYRRSPRGSVTHLRCGTFRRWRPRNPAERFSKLLPLHRDLVTELRQGPLASGFGFASFQYLHQQSILEQLTSRNCHPRYLRRERNEVLNFCLVPTCSSPMNDIRDKRSSQGTNHEPKRDEFFHGGVSGTMPYRGPR